MFWFSEDFGLSAKWALLSIFCEPKFFRLLMSLVIGLRGTFWYRIWVYWCGPGKCSVRWCLISPFGTDSRSNSGRLAAAAPRPWNLTWSRISLGLWPNSSLWTCWPNPLKSTFWPGKFSCRIRYQFWVQLCSFTWPNSAKLIFILGNWAKWTVWRIWFGIFLGCWHQKVACLATKADSEILRFFFFLTFRPSACLRNLGHRRLFPWFR